jgi:hypothetical protein
MGRMSSTTIFPGTLLLKFKFQTGRIPPTIGQNLNLRGNYPRILFAVLKTGRRSPTKSKHTKIMRGQIWGRLSPSHCSSSSWCSWSFPETLECSCKLMNIHRRDADQRRHQSVKTCKNHTSKGGNSYKTTISRGKSLEPPSTVDTGARYSLRRWKNHRQPPTLFRWRKSKSKQKQNCKKNVGTYQLSEM